MVVARVNLCWSCARRSVKWVMLGAVEMAWRMWEWRTRLSLEANQEKSSEVRLRRGLVWRSPSEPRGGHISSGRGGWEWMVRVGRSASGKW